MNQEQFFAGMEKIYSDCVAISRRKNSDYASDADPFSNFKGASLVGLSPEEGISLRMSDKLARIGRLLAKKKASQTAAVTDESIEDTLKDLINYSAILLLYYKSPVEEYREKIHVLK